MFYLNQKNQYDNNRVETIDQASTRKEAREMLKNYNLYDYMNCYISSRSTKEWRESS